MLVADYKQRQHAIDVTKSFIVQAPAGSGKTELLTQRFLNLLSTVNNPEEIIAITFTKKAASEMRNRILNALERAAYQPEPIEEHALQTWNMAKKALEHSQQQQWNILENPNRLKVQTIDSLCASLVKQLPIMARLGSAANIVEDAEELYQQAAINLLISLEEKPAYFDDLSALLLHLDNNYNRVIELFIEMLSKRNQWLPHIVKSRHQVALREKLEQNLQQVIEQSINNLHKQLHSSIFGELLAVINFSREQLSLLPWDTMPVAEINQLQEWQYLANMLLTKEFTWRKILDVRNGFPPGKNKQEKTLFSQYKKQCLALIQELSTDENLRIALEKVLTCPPSKYTESQWAILENLLNLLPVLAAHLQIIFQQTGTIDFVALTDSALQALGEEDNPTELALQLDYKIQHLLIDEFQDTSLTQFHLLEKLTEGWQANDGRSLFLVGDPMQSIYGFRAAEVGLFLRAQQYGIGNISLIPLTLEVNFRSNKKIVDWINTNFTEIFPNVADIASGAVPMSRAIAFHQDESVECIKAYQHDLENTEITETDTIVDIIKKTPIDCSIAILVKAKNHLREIIPALQHANIAYQAIEIERLGALPIIQDLLSLTAALLHFADRLAWLSVLRAPWCALSLRDLHLVSQQADTKTIWDNITDAQIIQQLSVTGQQQLTDFVASFKNILFEWQRMSISDGLYSAWLQLGGSIIAKNSAELESAHAFFNLVQKLEIQGNFSLEILQRQTEKLFAKPNPKTNVQLMTIHKAKGLEFDIVILPKLERGKPSEPTKLLLWLEKPGKQNNDDLLLAPIKAKAESKDLLYNYVKSQHTIKQRYESDRLLYVATTRAKKQLYLLSSYSPKEDKEFTPIADSFLSKLWLHCEKIFKSSQAERLSINRTEQQLSFKRISQPIQSPLITLSKNNSYQAGNRPIIEDYTARTIGTLIHILLHQMSETPIKEWPNLLTNKTSWENKLRTAGISDIAFAYKKLEQVITNCSQSQRALWILQQESGKSEYSLTAAIDHHFQSIVIDRLFTENNTCWVIDYKTSEPKSDDTTEQFLLREKQVYLRQLNNYAKIVQQLHLKPIKLGLYFPLCDLWIEWDYKNEEIPDASYI